MSRDDSQLVLHDIPIFLWIFGLVFAAFGAFMYLQSGPPMVWAFIFIAIGLGALLFSSVLTITADRIRRTLKLEYRSVLLRSIKQLSFDEIAGIDVERSFSRNTATYRVILLRKDGEVIRLRSSSSSGSGRKEKQAGRLRDFIGVRGFDTSPAALFYAKNKMTVGETRETNGVSWKILLPPANASPGTHWHSADTRTPGVFLFVAQKAEGQATGGFLASLGSMMFKQALSMQGFQKDDTPGLEHAGPLAPLDPKLEPHFMAFTNDPASAQRIFNTQTVSSLADWAGRNPLRQFRGGSRFSQVVILFSPNGLYLNTLNLLPSDLVSELTGLGVALVQAQRTSLGSSSS